MPYIKPEYRKDFDPLLDKVGLNLAVEGDLNYCITRLCLLFLNKRGMKNYKDLNSVIGALECAKLELYRRQIAPYEDLKIQENGDVL